MNEYENCLDKKEFTTLNSFFDGEEEEGDYNDCKKHWVGMPEFYNTTDEIFTKLIVKFKTKQDFVEFTEKLDIKITTKTKYIWYPLKERNKTKSYVWITDDE